MTVRSSVTVLVASLLLVIACSAPVVAAADIDARLPDGRKLRFHCEGTGSPTVILEGAYGSSWTKWGSVLTDLGRRTRTCGYNRAGLLPSDGGPLPRDADAIARDLAQGLQAARIDGPYVLVGHSIGGLFVRDFYDRHPKAVVGMVLVDPSVEHQAQRFSAAFPGAAGASLDPLIAYARECVVAGEARLAGRAAAIPDHCGKDPRRVVGMWSNMASELTSLDGATALEIDRGRRSYGRLPLIVLTAGRMYSGRAATLWRSMHEEIARRSTRGEHRLVEGSGHNIPKDEPDAVVRAVGDVIAMTQATPRGR